MDFLTLSPRHRLPKPQNRFGMVVGALMIAFSPAALSEAALKPLQAVVVNDASQPVPVTATQPLPVTVIGGTKTHLGVPVQDHVMLASVGGPPTGPCGRGSELARMLPDGTSVSSSFVVPAGRTLVVLDVNAVVEAGSASGFPAGSTVTAALVIATNMNSTLAPVTTDGVLITTAGIVQAAVSTSLTAGAIFGPGQQPCLRADVRAGLGGYDQSHRISSGSGVRGYLLTTP